MFKITRIRLTGRTTVNLGSSVEQLLTPNEVENVFRELLSFYDPPTRCVERVQSMFSRESSTLPFKFRTFCGLCGKNYGTKTWHCVDRVWACHERNITGHTCQNSQIYDYAFQQMIKRAMLMLLPERPKIIKECERLVRRYISDEIRRNCALEYVRSFADVVPTTIELGEESGFIVEHLTIFPRDRVVAKVISGEKISFQQAHYTPHTGWSEYPERLGHSPLNLTEDELRAIAMAARKEGEHTMTADQKKAIITLREKGATVGTIADMLNINVNTIKTHLRRHPVAFVITEPVEETRPSVLKCKHCGRDIVQVPGRKEKLYCSDECRNRWWNTHMDKVQRKAYTTFVCLTCGKRVTVYGNDKRKYCSHDCYIEHRFGHRTTVATAK